MEAHGIDASLRDDFVRHAVKFDDDDNMYLKKSEIEAAAAAWESAETSEEEITEETPEETPEEVPQEEESAVEEDGVQEEEVAEASEDTAESKNCPICGASNSMDATTCECGFSF